MEIVEIKTIGLKRCTQCGKIRFIKRFYARDKHNFLRGPFFECIKCLKKE